MKNLFIPILCLLGLNLGSASTWFVHRSVSASGDGKSWETAFQAIQEAVDAASSGDTVTVAEGVYVENIHFNGKNIILRSTDPLDSDVVARTIIDGGGVDSVVRFSGSENPTCVLSGFTIQNGSAACGGGVCGRTSLARTLATIQNNVIKVNSADSGGGLAFCDGVIQNNVVSGNSAEYWGGGIYACGGLVQNSLVCENSAGLEGGGFHACGGTIRNNTISGNSAKRGGGLSWCAASVLNCILWGNPTAEGGQLYESSEPTYSCIENWTAGGEGNISGDPRFAANGYWLSADSPCIDAGKNEDWMWEAVDLGGNPRVQRGILSLTVDMGAYEYLYQPGTWYVDSSVTESGDGTSWEAAFKTIQEGIDTAMDGDTVIVAEGTYLENIHFKGKNIVLRSADPLDSDVVARTIIDGSQSGSVVTFSGTEDETCVLSGFTITNGDAHAGGGVCGGSGQSRTHATIHNNVVTGNSAQWGGGLCYCDGTIRNNTVFKNLARGAGGGLQDCDGTIQNNTITANSGGGFGGGIHLCDGVVRNCIIWANSASEAPQLEEGREPTYCCIQGWTGGGESIITSNPHFVFPQNGDFHLGSWSPCIDAGDPDSPFPNEPQPNGGRVNMGAYGDTPEAASASLEDTDGDLLPDEWEMHFFGHYVWEAFDDPDGDGFPNLDEFRRATRPSGPDWYTSASVSVSGDGTSWQTAFKTIQEGIDAASDGHMVCVGEGTYVENIHFNGKNIALRGTDPTDSDVVARTVIDGTEAGPVVTFAGT